MALCSRTDTANSRETYAGREVTKSCAASNFVMALCSRRDTANSRETYAGHEVTKSCAASNYVSADRIQVDRIGLGGTELNPDLI